MCEVVAGGGVTGGGRGWRAKGVAGVWLEEDVAGGGMAGGIPISAYTRQHLDLKKSFILPPWHVGVGRPPLI